MLIKRPIALSLPSAAWKRPNNTVPNTTGKQTPDMEWPTGCNRADGKKPDSLTLIPWMNGNPMVCDFTCTDTLAKPKTYLKGNCKNPDDAVRKRETDKQQLYQHLEPLFHFIPICVETFGPWAEGKKLVRKIGELLKEVTGEKRLTSFPIQRISVAVQKGNAASILGTVRAEL